VVNLLKNFRVQRVPATKHQALSMVAVLCVALTPQVASAEHVIKMEKGERWIGARLLVQSTAGLSDAEFDKVIKPHGGYSVERIPEINFHVINLPAHADERAVLKILSRNRHVKFAELDKLVSLEQTTNDPYLGNAWHLPKIQAPVAWDTSRGLGVIVAVLDTGVDSTHPDLAGQLVPGWNMFDNNSNTADVHGHGTQVAGVIAAASNNALGVASVAWQAKVMPMRISQPDGWASFSTIANGLTWAVNNGARVANISYGVSGSSSVQSAAQYMRSKGGVVIVAGGNSGVYDATPPHAALLSVSATNSSDARTSWSTYGEFIDISAPGSGIWTTARGGGYAAVSGTSFASPTTAGVAALIKAVNPNLAPSQIDTILTTTVTDLGTSGYDIYYGHGRVNAAAAVAKALATPALDTTAPVVAIASPVAGSTASGVVVVGVNASDNTGVARVDFYVNGKLIANDTTAPYSFSWDSALVANGTASLVAYAVDVAGNQGASKAVGVTVSNNATSSTVTAPDTTAPTLSLVNPARGSTVSGVVAVQLVAKDNSAVNSLSLYIDNVLVSMTSASTLTYNWDTASFAKGRHVLRATAVDAAGNEAALNVAVKK